jgi:hypothetical protein
MGVRARVEDAKVLWEAGRHEGAVIHVLIAVAATVRKRYPLPIRDSVAYKKFIRDELGKITNGPIYGVAFFYDGKGRVWVGDLIYKFLRCGLVHEGHLPSNFRLVQPVAGPGIPFGVSPDGKPYDGQLMNQLELNDVLGFPIGWIWNLIRVVAEAPENKSEFPDGSYPVPTGYSVNAGLQVFTPDDHQERCPHRASDNNQG